MNAPALGHVPSQRAGSSFSPQHRPSASVCLSTGPFPSPHKVIAPIMTHATRRESLSVRTRAERGEGTTHGPEDPPSTSAPSRHSSRFLVRRARPDDADAIARICEASFPDQVRNPGFLRKLFLPAPSNDRVDLAAQVRLALVRKRKAAAAHRAYRLER